MIRPANQRVMRGTGKTAACIGLGSNLGDRAAVLESAIAALATTPGVIVRAVSPPHESAPVGGPPGQGPFLNAAALLETTLDPHALHAILRSIEQNAGRVRHVRWGERTLDLDLLLFGGLILTTDELTIPHPRMGVRRFVLAPLAAIAPNAVHPTTRRTIRRLLRNLDHRRLGLVGWPLALQDQIAERVPHGWSITADRGPLAKSPGRRKRLSFAVAPCGYPLSRRHRRCGRGMAILRIDPRSAVLGDEIAAACAACDTPAIAIPWTSIARLKGEA